jgi:predicted NBD/HSP70 family sugar kinase
MSRLTQRALDVIRQINVNMLYILPSFGVIVASGERGQLEDVHEQRTGRLMADETFSLRPSDRQLLDVLHRHGELDRGELARLSGLPRSTVTDSVARLRRRAAVVERSRPPAARTGAGRPAGVLALAPPSGTIGVVWLTHESLHAHVLGFDGTRLAELTLDPFRPGSSGRIAMSARELLTEALDQASRSLDDMRCLVVALPSPVSAGDGDGGGDADRPALSSGPARSSRPALASRLGPHIALDPWRELGQTLGVPAWLENDANLAALGEGAFGAARDMSSFIYIKIVQGIGAGLILDRRLHRGVSGLAGELAHIHTENDGSVCRCGGRGCLMTTFNARRLVDRIQAVHPAATSMDDVMSLAEGGDPGVWRLLHDLGLMIGRSLAEFSLYVAPDGVIIDGILQNAATPVIDGIREAMYQFAPPAIVSQVRVVVGALADTAELHGAAVLARSSMFGHDLLMPL